jgi:putative oxidoreductase
LTIGLSIYRIAAGLIFISSGTMKVFNFPPEPAAMPAFSPLTQMRLGGLLKIVGSLAIVLGLFTRPIWFVLVGMMAVAFFKFHAPRSLFPAANNRVPAVSYCFFFLHLMSAGAGT